MKVTLSTSYDIEWHPGSKEVVLETWNDNVTFDHEELKKLLQFLDSVRSEILPPIHEPGTMKCSNCGQDVHVGRAPLELDGYRYWYNCQVCNYGELLASVPEEVMDEIEEMNKRQDTQFSNPFEEF